MGLLCTVNEVAPPRAAVTAPKPTALLTLSPIPSCVLDIVVTQSIDGLYAVGGLAAPTWLSAAPGRVRGMIGSAACASPQAATASRLRSVSGAESSTVAATAAAGRLRQVSGSLSVASVLGAIASSAGSLAGSGTSSTSLTAAARRARGVAGSAGISSSIGALPWRTRGTSGGGVMASALEAQGQRLRGAAALNTPGVSLVASATVVPGGAESSLILLEAGVALKLNTAGDRLRFS